MTITPNINLTTSTLKSLLGRDLGRIFIVICLFTNTAFSQNEANQICGKWMSSENDLKVEVYQQNGQYRAKVTWFACLPGEEMKNFYDTKILRFRSEHALGWVYKCFKIYNLKAMENGATVRFMTQIQGILLVLFAVWKEKMP